MNDRSSRLSQLANAVALYGRMSLEIMQKARTVGNEVIGALPEYLGDGAEIFGVPPVGDWKAADYRDAKFSTYWDGVLAVAPIQMGIAVNIPNLRDSGSTWVRVVLEFSVRGRTIAVGVGDDSREQVLVDAAEEKYTDLICQRIFEYLLTVFNQPVRLASAVESRKLGFLR